MTAYQDPRDRADRAGNRKWSVVVKTGPSTVEVKKFWTEEEANAFIAKIMPAFGEGEPDGRGEA